MWTPPSSIRRSALEKLAVLSAPNARPSGGTEDLTRLGKLCPHAASQANGAVQSTTIKGSRAAAVPLGLRELQALLALCQAAPLVADINSAAQLLRQLSSYLPDAYSQAFSPSPFLKDLEPSPWETITLHVTSAILSLGLRHPSLRDHGVPVVNECLQGWAQSAESLATSQFEEEASHDREMGEHGVQVLVHTVSMLGFLKAATEKVDFWTADERLSIIQELRSAFSEKFMVALETVLSIVRNRHSTQRLLKDWKRYCKHYAGIYRPLGAMLLQHSFMEFVKASSAMLLLTPEALPDRDVLSALQEFNSTKNMPMDFADDLMIEAFVELAADEMKLLEDGSDFLQLGSAWQQRLAFDVKADTLITFLCCTLLNSEIAEPEVLVAWLDALLKDPVQIADVPLGTVVLKCMAILAKTSPSIASALSRSLPRFIVQNGLTHELASVAADCLARILRLLPQDAVISTLYSLGNVLSGGGNGDQTQTASPLLNGSGKSNRTNGPYSHRSPGSAISLTLSDSEETSFVYGIVVRTVAYVAASSKDEKIVALAQSMLIQKLARIGPSVDATIITETALLGVHSSLNDFRSLIKLYARLSREALLRQDHTALTAVAKARHILSTNIRIDSPLFGMYLEHLLDEVVSKGDAQDNDNSNVADAELAAQEIEQLLPALASLALTNAGSTRRDFLTEDIVGMQRDAWFNVVVHGFTLNSERGKKYLSHLRALARVSQPLIAEDRADQLESDVELNTVLRRGMNGPLTVFQKRSLMETYPSLEPNIKPLSYPEVVFLNAANMVESLRAASGDCTKGLIYFLDPKLKSSAMGTCMAGIALRAVNIYLNNTIVGRLQAFSAPYLAKQLSVIFTRCCHRIKKVQDVATSCANHIIDTMPSALCHRSSLFALLDVLDVMWISCLEEEADEYEWTSRFTSNVEKISVELSDNFEFRKETLSRLHSFAKAWMLKTMSLAPLDVKGLLQTYLSEYEDASAFGHISLGRSFALEMGAAIPATDQRLVAIEQCTKVNVNTASDFFAQYTTRQEYRFTREMYDQEEDDQSRRVNHIFGGSGADIGQVLGVMANRIASDEHVSNIELREIMRKGAALLSKSRENECTLVQHLVGIPFAIFSKDSIKLGVSLWTGLIKENPELESRLMVEIFAHWEGSIRKRQGIYDSSFRHLDPFIIKQEFAPSNRERIKDWQLKAQGLIAPHFRIVQFLSSRFRASLLSNPHVENMYLRFAHVTLNVLADTASHPLCREVHFHIILLASRIIRSSNKLEAAVAWRLKDRVLSAALAWFSGPPRWTYGGNRIQLKAELRLLVDVENAIADLDFDEAHGKRSLKSLQAKKELLLALVRNEGTRLEIWLFPLNYERKNHVSSTQSRYAADASVVPLLKVAWAENPSIAVQLLARFHSARLAAEVRSMILSFPEEVVSYPDALEILIGSALPDDVSSQLKYLLFWAPVNPMTAVTYFLPSYGHHPCVIQYAMKALESHTVDITFFYVPQIVQTLRYDSLGYVARYIIETAKFSQLFAHQIIWNMKANAYRDEESQIPDPVKPTLDTVMDSLIASFSDADRAFYEREFSFFNEITGVSGKLRPYIKRPKAEKKQKIEEELRKVHVEVGVYLPSNPDGVVIGIDRKSGKPLQSHAKAPYMATFRIRKEKGVHGLQEDLQRGKPNGSAVDKKGGTYEVWQSAIFKVGDDCRQDVLALQMIAAFRGIFHDVGLDVYVFPYRVTATAPGCGVIDVLPNTISRDMLGREAVNGLLDYFVSRYGGEDSIRFQEARSNFVKSMAAYSVISYLLQFKDRHNGNIMIDDAGHILHIDFGFCFDIAPGGIKFERAPFKLTGEMVAVMGGSVDSQPFHWFEEMCIKAFLASRLHAEHLAHMVVVMLDSGLPCFKPETIQHFKDRFVLNRSEREAADFMRDLIRKSYSSYSTRGYDQFQLLTNGIPY